MTSERRFLVEQLVGEHKGRRLRAWLHPEYETIIEFEVASLFNVDEWYVDLAGSWRFDDCANFGTPGHSLVHTCDFDGFAEWCFAVALIPNLVHEVRCAARLD